MPASTATIFTSAHSSEDTVSLGLGGLVRGRAGGHDIGTVGDALLRVLNMPQSGSGAPARIKELKHSRFVSAYHMDKAGPDGGDVVAIRCRRRRAVLETWIYEQLLPRLTLPALRFYGHVIDTDGAHWLFLEDAGGHAYLPHDSVCRAAAARWLGAFHVVAAEHALHFGGAVLPSRGTHYYKIQLRSAIASLRGHRRDPGLLSHTGSKNRALLDELLAYCENADMHWDQICHACDCVPSTIVHGDFADRNLRMRNNDMRGADRNGGECNHDSPELLPFDWEDAAWGSPAIDLVQDDEDRMYDAASPDLAVYTAMVAPHWPMVNETAIRRLSDIGRLFWQILAIRQDASSMSSEWLEPPLEHFQLYASGLSQVLETLGWKR